LFLSNCGFSFFRLIDLKPAHTAELVPGAITVTTNAAKSRGGIVREILGRVIRSLFRIDFGSETLDGFQRGRQSIGARLGTEHFRLHAPVQVFQFGAVQWRIRWQTGGPGISLVFVHESNHSTAGPF
jgi:hypothetical protein